MVGPGWKFFVWQLISVFAFKNFYCTFDTQLAENENTFYMFSLGFSYYSKDWWQFCNFLHKLTGGILVNKHTTLLMKSDMLNGHQPHLLQTHLPWNPSSHKYTTLLMKSDMLNGHQPHLLQFHLLHRILSASSSFTLGA